MQIHVKLFARARDLAGASTLELLAPNECSVSHARTLLLSHYPALASLMPQLIIAVDGNYAPDQTLLKEGCALACFPPVSRG